MDWGKSARLLARKLPNLESDKEGAERMRPCLTCGFTLDKLLCHRISSRQTTTIMAAPTGEQPGRDTNMTTQPATAVAAVFATIELAEGIFEFLHTKDIVTCQRVCHKFSDIVTSTTSNIIKQKVFIEPLPLEFSTAVDLSEASGISAESAFFMNEVHKDHGVPGDPSQTMIFGWARSVSGLALQDFSEKSQVLTFNPILQNFGSVILDEKAQTFTFDALSLLRIVGTDCCKRWSQAYFCQPPAPGFVLDDTLLFRAECFTHGRLAMLRSGEAGVQIGASIGSLCQALTEVAEKHGGGIDLNSVVVLLDPTLPGKL